jgi:hypothetical protein
MPVSDKYSYNKVMSSYQDLQNERSEWESEWRVISEYLLPGRGIYQSYAKPRKRKLTSPRVVNNMAEDALYVLTSGMHGNLTSPSRPWFKLSWSDSRLEDVEPLKQWLQNAEDTLHAKLQASNFYAIINSFYVEYAGFGTGCTYVGEDTDDSAVPFRFELLTAGEYAFSTNSKGIADVFYRTIFMTPRQLVDRFPDTASKDMQRRVKNNEGGVDRTYVTVLECVMKYEYQDKPFTQIFYEMTSTGTRGAEHNTLQKPLLVKGFYEFPYPVGRWGTIGSDIYGIGPGSRALPDIKRLQEMEKAFLMATHKAINPPLNAPARMRNKLNTLPGGYNYYSNPNEKVEQLYAVNFDYGGVSAAIERVEQRIQRNFFNDIFLTASRDPNASPLKARQVDVHELEKMLRLGPVIERLQHEFFQPIIERCFNICLRKNVFELLDPALAEMAGEYKITLVSPLASAQKASALQGINSFLGFIGQAAQFDQSIMDNIDVDEATREYADITGVKLGVLRLKEDVQAIRQQRMALQQAQAQAQAQAQDQGMASQLDAERATTQKTQAEAGTTLLEGQQMAQDMGMI